MRILLAFLLVLTWPATAKMVEENLCSGLLNGGSVTAMKLEQVQKLPDWRKAFENQAKDSRYYEIVNQTINLDKLDYYYLVVRNGEDRIVAIQPAFLLNQDTLEGSSEKVRAFAAKVRKLWPRFATLRTFMIGNAAGAGHLSPSNDEDRAAAVRVLSQHVIKVAKDLGASLVVFKEFPRGEFNTMNELVTKGGFSVIPSLPRTKQELGAYASFDDFLKKQSSNGRRQIKKNLEASTNKDVAPVTFEVMSVAGDSLERIFELYKQTFAKATMSFEKLTPEYFRLLGERMPDHVRFFTWKQNGKIIGMQLCLIEGENLLTEYVGMDYAVSQDLKLYFRMHYDTVAWAIDNGFKNLLNTPTAYEPKRRFGQVLFPVDLYIAQTYSPILHKLFRMLSAKMDPTVNEPELANFANFDQLALPHGN